MTFNFSYLDYFVIIVLALGLIFGLIKGWKVKITALSLLIAFLVVFYAGTPICKAIMSTNFGTQTLTDFYASKLPATEAFTNTLDTSNLSMQQSQISAALTEMGVPNFFQGFVISNVYLTTSTVSIAIASSFAYMTILGSLGLLSFILIFVILKLTLGKVSESVFGEDGKGFFGRITGGLLGVFKASVALFIIFVGFTLVNQIMLKSGNTVLQDWLNSQLEISNGSSFSFAKVYYDLGTALFNWISLGANNLVPDSNTTESITALLMR